MTMLIKTAFITDTEAVLVIAFSVGTYQLFMSRLVGSTVAGYVSQSNQFVS